MLYIRCLFLTFREPVCSCNVRVLDCMYLLLLTTAVVVVEVVVVIVVVVVVVVATDVKRHCASPQRW
jgi:hypothetical protein